MILYNVKYNSQRDNFSFKGKFNAWWQCFTTSSWMLMSYYIKSIKAEDDNGLSEYLDDVESSIGKPGIGEKIKRKFKYITGRTSLWWIVQKHGIEKWMWRNGIKGNVVFCDGIEFNKLYDLLRNGPVIVGTKKLGGLPGGHIILMIGTDVYNDPFGNAHTKYSDHNGRQVVYKKDFLIKYTGKKIRCMYWRGKE